MIVSRRHEMHHQVIYWRMARREADVDDAELAALLHLERRSRRTSISSTGGDARSRGTTTATVGSPQGWTSTPQHDQSKEFFEAASEGVT
jgi:hypothetical protein